ncbi:putative lipoprotein, partial [Bacteroidetes bacterium oral taxon 272 str. F0290]
MKNILTYIGIASLILLTGCANNEVTEQDLSGKTSERTLTLTASMPTGRPETRLALTETDEGNISVKWKEGDKISLCFVSGETVRTLSGIPVTNIREEGKKADFDFSLPEGIHYPFNL